MAETGSAVLLSGFSYLLVSQVSSRAVTFVLNLVVTRLLSPEAYGLASVQFHLINTVILFLSREGFRRGCLRTPVEGESSRRVAQRTLAISALCIPVGLLVTAVTCRLAYSWGDGVEVSVHHTAVRIQGAAAILELLSEPLYILAAVQLRFRLRALVDTAAIAAKSGVSVALLQGSGLPPALALSWAQVAFAAVTLACYGAAFADLVLGRKGGSDGKSASAATAQWGAEGGLPANQQLAAADGSCSGGAPADAARASAIAEVCPTTDQLAAGGAQSEQEPGRQGSSSLRQRRQQAKEGSSQQAASPTAQPLPLLHGPTLWLCASFSLQAAEKLVLAEGSKMVMVGLQSAYSQGVYGLVVNLGGLVVRTAFQPFEDAAFTAFSTARGGRAESGRLLTVLVRSAAIVGLVAAAFGPAYSWLLLRLVYSEQWSATQAPAALAAYSGYILLLAINGILEAYVHAAANHRQLVHINVALIAFAAAHMGLSVICVRWGGAIGLIGADSINMLLRISFSLLYVRLLFEGEASLRLTAFCPSHATLVALLAVFLFTGVSAPATLGAAAGGPLTWLLQRRRGSAGSEALHLLRGSSFWAQATAHVGTGAACLAAVVLTVRRAESALWHELATLRRQRSGPDSKGA